jgi:hypothetical protein
VRWAGRQGTGVAALHEGGGRGGGSKSPACWRGQGFIADARLQFLPNSPRQPRDLQ